MTLNCGKIAQNIAGGQCGQSVAGLDNEIYIINFDDIDRSESTVSDGVVSEIAMVSGTYGYKYTSNNKAFEGTSALQVGTYATTHEHSVIGRIFVNTQEAKDELDKLAQGKFVVIVKNLSNAEDATKYEVYGWDNGLKCTALDKNTADGDGVIYSFTLASDENAREGSIPKSFFKTSLTVTETALSALLPPAVIPSQPITPITN